MTTACPHLIQIAAAQITGTEGMSVGAQLFGLDANGCVWRRIVLIRETESDVTFKWERLSKDSEELGRNIEGRIYNGNWKSSRYGGRYTKRPEPYRDAVVGGTTNRP